MVKVRSHKIIGTNTTIYSAWALTSAIGGYHTITYIDDQCYGQMGTERITPELDALPPRSSERSAAVKSYRAARCRSAIDAILDAHPELRRDPDAVVSSLGHEIEVTR